MTKKRLILFSGVALTVLLLAGMIGVAVVSADEPEPPVPFGRGGGMGGFGRHGGGRGMMGGFASGGQWTMFDTAAEALGLTPEEYFAELRAGKSLTEIAEEQGVELEAVQDAMNAARGEAMRQGIEQAVEDGSISQEQADWMLEGLEQGFAGGRGFSEQGFGRGWGGCDHFQDD